MFGAHSSYCPREELLVIRRPVFGRAAAHRSPIARTPRAFHEPIGQAEVTVDHFVEPRDMTELFGRYLGSMPCGWRDAPMERLSWHTGGTLMTLRD
jgi:hypothetical protein